MHGEGMQAIDACTSERTVIAKQYLSRNLMKDKREGDRCLAALDCSMHGECARVRHSQGC
jgi:hypothetical protein